MYLAIGICFEQGYTGSIGTDYLDEQAIADELTAHLGMCPDEILVIKNDNVTFHWVADKNYIAT
jgi:hypothetical protein